MFDVFVFSSLMFPGSDFHVACKGKRNARLGSLWKTNSKLPCLSMIFEGFHWDTLWEEFFQVAPLWRLSQFSEAGIYSPLAGKDIDQ